jgi:Protein of unknown function (DUF2721)
MLGSDQSSVENVTRVIQLALTPVFLLTAVAALLNVFSTRLGRVADRVDLLSADLQRGAADTEFLSAQLDFLRTRSLILDVAVVLATVGGAATCAAALVLFLGALRDGRVVPAAAPIARPPVSYSDLALISATPEKHTGGFPRPSADTAE